MRDISRRGMIGLGAGAAAAMGLAACGTDQQDGHGGGGGSRSGEPGASDKPGASSRPARLIGDGSTSFTGKQPKQPAKPVPLEAGQTLRSS